MRILSIRRASLHELRIPAVECDLRGGIAVVVEHWSLEVEPDADALVLVAHEVEAVDEDAAVDEEDVLAGRAVGAETGLKCKLYFGFNDVIKIVKDKMLLFKLGREQMCVSECLCRNED